MSEGIRVSACMACYNGEKYIREQILSVLSELGVNDELVISDDHSTDSTLSIITAIDDSRIHLVENRLRKGVNGNFENAMIYARGQYIFLVDQDDIWLEGKLEACLEGLKESVCVVHDAYITDGFLEIKSESFFKDFNCRRGFMHNWLRNGYLGCAMAFRKEILEYVLPIPEKLSVWHDIWIGSIAELKGGVSFITFKGIKFRRHNFTTSITSKHGLPLIKKISYRLQLLWYLFMRLKFRK